MARHNYLTTQLLTTLLCLSSLVLSADLDLTAKSSDAVTSDLQTAATGIGGGFGHGGGGFGQGGGGYGGNYGGSGGFGGGHGESSHVGGAKQVGTGGDFNSQYGGSVNNVKGHGTTYGNTHKGTAGFKGTQGFAANNGHNKAQAGHVNNALKKGNFAAAGGSAKTAKNDGTIYGNNDVAVKAAKGHKFGAKGNHKKGHATKGFRNQVHKDEFVKTQTFHDENNFDDFFDKFGDEGAFRNDVKGDRFFKGHHANTFDKNDQKNAGHFLDGHNKAANKGISSLYGQKAHNNNNDKFTHQGGNNFGNGFNKGVHNTNQYGGNFGSGFGKKNGGFGDQGYQSGYGGSGGQVGGGGGGYNGGGFGFGR